MHQMGLFEVKRIPVEVVGVDNDSRARGPLATEAAMRERLESRVNKFSGYKIWEIDLKRIRASVVRDQWVRDVLISRSFPNEIKVRVRPKTPVLVVVASHGALLPVTEDAELLDAVATESWPDVPLLRGDVFEKDPQARERAVKFIMSLPTQGALSRRNVSDLSWTREEGFALTLIQPKVEVKLGDDRIDLKVMRVNQVLNYMSANQLKGRVIDASFSKKVLVRLRKGP